MLETGEFATINDLAEREKIAPSYMTRVLRLTLLAPDMVEATLDGRQEFELTLARALEPFPAEWALQVNHFGREPETRRSFDPRRLTASSPVRKCHDPAQRTSRFFPWPW